jgi:hypothetical protein
MELDDSLWSGTAPPLPPAAPPLLAPSAPTPPNAFVNLLQAIYALVRRPAP